MFDICINDSRDKLHGGVDDDRLTFVEHGGRVGSDNSTSGIINK